MARAPIMAAGGIVLRRAQPPRIAVVRLRKRDEWVLPKGKLDDGETPRDAARREVLEETGHKVTVHEFLGTLVHDTGTRAKVVHYWRMEAAGDQVQPLMDDVRAVDWLPLDAAVDRLSRDHEKTFLQAVGPYALAGLIRKTKAKPEAEVMVGAAPEKTADEKAAIDKAAAAEKVASARKRRSRVTEQPAPELASETAVPAASEPVVTMDLVTPEPQPELPETIAPEPVTPIEEEAIAVAPQAAEPTPERVPADVERVEAVVAAIKSLVPDRAATRSGRADVPSAPETSSAAPERSDADLPTADSPATAGPSEAEPRLSLAQKMRAWLGRAA